MREKKLIGPTWASFFVVFVLCVAINRCLNCEVKFPQCLCSSRADIGDGKINCRHKWRSLGGSLSSSNSGYVLTTQFYFLLQTSFIFVKMRKCAVGESSALLIVGLLPLIEKNIKCSVTLSVCTHRLRFNHAFPSRKCPRRKCTHSTFSHVMLDTTILL